MDEQDVMGVVAWRNVVGAVNDWESGGDSKRGQ